MILSEYRYCFVGKSDAEIRGVRCDQSHLIVEGRVLRVLNVYRHGRRETDGQTLQSVQHEQQANIVRVPAEIRPCDRLLDLRRIRSSVGHSYALPVSTATPVAVARLRVGRLR